jgi:hypothetical protein
LTVLDITYIVNIIHFIRKTPMSNENSKKAGKESSKESRTVVCASAEACDGNKTEFASMISVWRTFAEYHADQTLAHPALISFSVDEYHIHDFIKACRELIAMEPNGSGAGTVVAPIGMGVSITIMKFFDRCSYVLSSSPFSVHYSKEAFEVGIDRMARAVASNVGNAAKAQFENSIADIEAANKPVEKDEKVVLGDELLRAIRIKRGTSEES